MLLALEPANYTMIPCKPLGSADAEFLLLDTDPDAELKVSKH